MIPLTPLEKAYNLIQEMHRNQMYGELRYIYHLQCVEEKVFELYGRNEHLQCVALLHDILEDTTMSEEGLRLWFDEEIVAVVVAVSKQDNESYDDYIAKVRTNELGLKVKIADTLCNLEESIKQGDRNRVRKYSKQLALLTE